MFFLIAWSTFSVFHHIVFYVQDQGASATRAALLFSLFLAAGTVSRFIFGILNTKISATLATLITLIMVAGAYLILLVFPYGTFVTYSWIVLFGLGVGGGLTCRPLLVFERYGSAGVGKLYGVATAVFTAGAFVGPASSGYIFDKTGSYRIAFVLALMLICGAIVLVQLFKRTAETGSKTVIL
jgi:MFS family permease